MAHLTVISGPMFADKTTTLISLIRGNSSHRTDNMVVKPSTDTRYDIVDEIVSHNQDSYPATSCDPGKLHELDLKNKSTIFIDEGHFFPDIVENVQEFLKSGTNVVVAGIDLDYHHRPFENMQTLITMAKTLIRCKAFCQCGEFATFTKMRKEMQNKENITVGGAEKYAPCCGKEECENTW